MGIHPDNVYELIDSTLREIKAVDKIIMEKILAHRKQGEFVYIYTYSAGHGVSDVWQWLTLNESDPTQVLYNIEEQIRIKSDCGGGFAFFCSVYDICRLYSDFKALKALHPLSDASKLKSAQKNVEDVKRAAKA